MDSTQKPKWQIITTVSLNANGGNCGEAEMEIVSGESYTLPTPTRDKYRFDGWYYGNVLVSQDGEWVYTADLELVAKWTANSYKINYELNNGSFDPEKTYPTSFTVESTAEELALVAPLKSFSVFCGWYLDDGFEQQLKALILLNTQQTLRCMLNGKQLY